MRKLRLNAAVALLLCLALLGGCAKSQAGPSSQPAETPAPSAEPIPTAEPTEAPSASPEELLLPLPEGSLELFFSSGTGAWGTSLLLQQNGAFTGTYGDSDMGVTGEGYPGGTHYICTFSGQFSDIRQIGEHSYSLTLSELTSDYEEGKEWIEDGVRYVSATPYGVEEGTEFILYLPDTPTEGLSREFLSWWPGRFSQEPSNTLELFGLYNVKMGYGFFG